MMVFATILATKARIVVSNSGVGAKKRGSMKAVVLMATPCAYEERGNVGLKC